MPGGGEGRGIQKIKESCEKSGNEFPIFQVCDGDITIVFKAMEMKESVPRIKLNGQFILF